MAIRHVPPFLGTKTGAEAQGDFEGTISPSANRAWTCFSHSARSGTDNGRNLARALSPIEAEHTAPTNFPPWWGLAAPPQTLHPGEKYLHVQCALPGWVCRSCGK
eukprot:GHVS01077391.1.p1 GENE.GHVS01077391.1~~GHVS01077391.1.p1  ORF type:complete len:105 (-),score=2.93 GHVS01077391.1:350-664(-)